MSRTLSLLGAALPAGLMPPARDNETGFWEPQKIAQLNDEILQNLDSEWDDVFAFRPREYLSNFDQFFLGRAVDVLKEEYNRSELIVLKDPRLSVLTAFWERALREAGYTTNYVIMVRNPLEVAESLRERDAFPREKSVLLWESYMLAAERDTRGLDRIFVAYDDLMNDWRLVARRIEGRTGVPFARKTANAALDIDRFLNRSMRHHEATADDLYSSADVPQDAKTLYRVLVSACKGGEIDQGAFDAIQTELTKMDALMGPLLADYRGKVQGIARELDELERRQNESAARAESLERELAEEREQRKEGEAALVGQYEAALAELQEARLRASNSEAEQVRLGSELETAKVNLRDSLERTAEADTAKSEAEGQLERERALRRLEEASLAEERQRNASLLSELKKREAALEARTTDLDSVRVHLAAAEVELESAKERLAQRSKEIEELGSALNSAQLRGRELEQRSKAQLQETAALIRTVLQWQQSTSEESEKLRRVRELHHAIMSEPRWWSLLPGSHRARLQIARLRRLKIFDGAAYLEKNPDVAAAGSHPVRHYLYHGIDEKRPV